MVSTELSEPARVVVKAHVERLFPTRNLRELKKLYPNVNADVLKNLVEHHPSAQRAAVEGLEAALLTHLGNPSLLNLSAEAQVAVRNAMLDAHAAGVDQSRAEIEARLKLLGVFSGSTALLRE